MIGRMLSLYSFYFLYIGTKNAIDLPIVVNSFLVTVVLRISFFLSESAIMLITNETIHWAMYGKADKTPFCIFIFY